VCVRAGLIENQRKKPGGGKHEGIWDLLRLKAHVHGLESRALCANGDSALDSAPGGKLNAVKA
jgi:hypothetical protein